MEMVFLLKGLDCPNCAAKIEKEVGDIDRVLSSSVNLISQTLVVNIDNRFNGDIYKIVSDIVYTHEPDVVVSFKTEKKTKTLSDSDNDEDTGKGTIFKLFIGALFYIIGLIISYFGDLNQYAKFILLVIAYIILGGEVVLKAAKNILKGRVFDENFLMSISTIGAFAIGEWPEAVAVMLFYQIGEFFQNYAVSRSRKSITELMDIRPDTARVKQGDQLVMIDPDQVKVGDTIIVKPGEKIPLDGVLEDGESMLDTKALTGESVPRGVKKGDVVLSGCINQSGLLTIKTTKTFGESTVTKIIDLVENAAAHKAPTENFITTFSRYYTPIVVGLAALLSVVPPLFGFGAWIDWIQRGFVFLVISCPCALVISIPLGFFGGIGGASRKGVLVKGSNYLEALNALDIVVFDKTGTLTKGIFKVTEVIPAKGYTQDDVLEWAAKAEFFSNHPIAVSIRETYKKPIDGNILSGFTEIAGHGISIHVGNESILVGNGRMMETNSIDYIECGGVGTKVYVAKNGQFVGCAIIADELKVDSKATITALNRLGVRKTVMLTGDSKQFGESVADQLGINEVYTDLLPADKVEKLELLSRQKKPKRKLAFVGDGINDAPVLALADVGIAMGGLGSDAAIEAADVVLMTDEPSKLIDAIAVAKFTKRIVMQNIVFALGVKSIFLILGALGVAGMWEAVFGDMGVAMIAILNAMRIMKR